MAFFVVLIIIIALAVWVVGLYNGLVTSRNGFRNAFARRADLPGGMEGSAIPFTTFLDYVESQPAGQRDHHWDDQYHVLLMDDIRYERCFRMEGEFQAGLQEIFQRIGRN